MKMFTRIPKSYKIVTMLFLLAILVHTTAIAQDLLWKANFTGAGNNIPNKSTIDSQNNIYILSTFTATCTTPAVPLTTIGGTDIAITKYDADGNHVWTQQIGGISADMATGIVVSPDNAYVYVTGYFQNTVLGISSTGGFDGFLAKFTNTGTRVWFKNVISASGATNQRPNGIKIDKNNNIVIAGWFFSDAIIGDIATNITLSTTQPIGLFVAQFDTAGTVINAKKIETTNSATKLYTFDVDTSGYYLSGYFNGDLLTDVDTITSKNNSIDVFIYKVGFDLSGKWVVTVGGISNDYLYSCSTGNNGYFYYGGYFASSTMTVDSTSTGVLSQKVYTNKTSDGKTDIFFAKCSSDGTLQWFNTAGSIENDYLFRALYKNGNFIAAGQYGASLTFNNKTIVPKDNVDAFAIVQNQNDNLVYLMPFGGIGTEVGETAVVDNNGNFVVIGDYTSSKIYLGTTDSLTNSNAGTKDMFIAKYDKGSLNHIVSPVSCNGGSDGAINITPEGTVVSPFSYTWTKDGDGAFTRTSEDISGLNAGTYRVTFTDGVGYIKTDSITLTDPLPVTTVLGSLTNVTCNNGFDGAIDINVSGGSSPYAYAWTTTGGSGLNAMVQDQSTLSSGLYHVSVTDSKGCGTTLNNLPITQPAKITYAGTIVTKINGGLGAVDLSVQGGTPVYSYVWSGPVGYTPENTEDIGSLTIAGNYSVAITDASSCTSDTTVYIADSHVMNAYLGSKTDVKCKGGSTGSITIDTSDVTGNAVFTWSPNVGNTATVVNLLAGNYSVTVTDDAPSSAVVSVTISEPDNALEVSIAKTDINCHNENNGIADANPTGGILPYNYGWTKDAQPYDGNNETVTGLLAGNYSVTVTDANNCTANSSVVIINPDIITFTGTVTGVTCENAKNDGTITLSNINGGSGSYSYQWSNGLTTQNVTLLAVGNYTVTVTDTHNCLSTNNYVIGEDSPMTASISVTSALCNGSANGALDASISGGHPGYTYLWSTSGNSNSISNLTAGEYTLTVTDTKLCQKTFTGIVTEPDILNISSFVQNNVSCFGGANGSVSLTVSGGTQTYAYLWDQGAGTLATASGLPAATFNVTVTDAHNCTTNGSYTITEPAALGLSEDVAAHINPLCFGSSDGSLTVIPSGGSGIYEYSLNNGAWVTTATLTGNSAGNYSLRVRDKNAITCMYSMPQNIVLIEPQVLTIASENVFNPTTNSPWDGRIEVTAGGGTTPYTYTLSTPESNETGIFTSLAPGDYTVSVTDSNNCGPVISGILTVSNLDGIPEVSSVVKIYPNPTTDYLFILSTGAQSTGLDLELISTNGLTVYKEKIASDKLENGAYKLNLMGITKGMYLLKINGSLAKDKIIVQ